MPIFLNWSMWINFGNLITAVLTGPQKLSEPLRMATYANVPQYIYEICPVPGLHPSTQQTLPAVEQSILHHFCLHRNMLHTAVSLSMPNQLVNKYLEIIIQDGSHHLRAALVLDPFTWTKFKVCTVVSFVNCTQYVPFQKRGEAQSWAAWLP